MSTSFRMATPVQLSFSVAQLREDLPRFVAVRAADDAQAVAGRGRRLARLRSVQPGGRSACTALAAGDQGQALRGAGLLEECVGLASEQRGDAPPTREVRPSRRMKSYLAVDVGRSPTDVSSIHSDSIPAAASTSERPEPVDTLCLGRHFKSASPTLVDAPPMIPSETFAGSQSSSGAKVSLPVGVCMSAIERLNIHASNSLPSCAASAADLSANTSASSKRRW